MPQVSVRDVATLAGVSVGTVSNVLNRPEKVKADTVARVQDAIAKLGFVRNDAARQLRAGHSSTIGIVVMDVNPFFTDIARAAETAAEKHGMSLILGNAAHSEDREAHYLDLFEQQRVQGVLISPIGDVSGTLSQLRSRGIPSVLVDRRTDEKLWSSVSVDDVAGGALATRHLIERGARRIAFVGGPLGIQQIADRLAGAREAVVAASDSVALEVVELEELSVLAGRAAGDAIVARKPADRPDAVFAANDLVAVGLLQAFALTHRAGTPAIRVPEEILLIGYDDIEFTASAVVPISSVRQPAALIGETAVEMIVDEVTNPGSAAHRRVVFQPELVVRASTSPRES